MIRSSIKGFESILASDIPKGSIVLITGAEGTLKSSLAFCLASSYVSDGEAHGLYATLEQGKESHMRNMSYLGIKESGNLHVFDYRDIFIEWQDAEPDMLKVTEEVIASYKEKYKDLRVFVLDSLNALYTLSSGDGDLRKSMYYFFSRLRDLGLTSFLVVETPPLQGDSEHDKAEYFLADGVIELGTLESAGNISRYIQVRKMRATKHDIGKHKLVIGQDGLSILGSMY